MTINSSSNAVGFDQTSKGWGLAAETYGEIMKQTNFTRMFAIDCLDLTIPVDAVKSDLLILDIASGSGALSIPAAERVQKHNGRVIATDFAPEMIDFQNREIESLPSAIPIETKIMDGQNLEFPDQTFDFCYSVFGLIFFPNQKKGFTEILRVLKPGGKVGIASWSETTFLSRLIVATMKKIYGDIGMEPPSKPYAMVSLADPVSFENCLRDCGFKNIEITTTVHTLRTNDVPEFARFYKNNPVIEALKLQLPEELRLKFEPTYQEIINESFKSGVVEIEGIAHIAVAQK
ncbi:putative SAM dependent methyltransferase [Heterostelium album PN500]|uniref:Putative SAM dependent methyltransferase n=1 Tax=Heterostelium pallidum (strain ATCC 26659 / Pp 5 / PN500) TaxID=670386 RepID=D3BNI4_HETP5|nr:putative SAM dependent methyltransferase [Heterostelium album PN500]EFA76935.1 putative SAM dependent methyltransferase [Heterostelium album PN500]|eukprot:XP_020429067.1 putative SAM dependent methyltransferase [Heterostelium album PN500]